MRLRIVLAAGLAAAALCACGGSGRVPETPVRTPVVVDADTPVATTARCRRRRR